jgi:hypothetical protein
MRARIRLLIAALLSLFLFTTLANRSSAVPMWSRKYNVACSDCHAFPSLQLTGMGSNFMRRGHRMEGDGAEKNFANLLSAHAEWSTSLQEHMPTPFEDPEFHIHLGGPISNTFSTYADVSLNDSEFEAMYAQFTKDDGADAYFSARAGRSIPAIIREYAGGLMSSASTPLIITDATLGANPFTPGRASAGVDAAQRWNRLFIQTGVVNGEDVPGQAAIGSHKDVFVSGQVSLSDDPTGVGAYYFNGGYDLVADSTGSVVFDRYDRAAVFANLSRQRFRLAGAYLRGREQMGSPDPRSKISGYYLQADLHPREWVTPFARYDWVKTENVAVAGTVKKGTLGVSAAIYRTEVTGGRLTVEVSRREGDGTRVNAGAVGLLWAF